MVINLIAMFFAAAGLLGFAATVRMQLPHLGFYSIGTELILYALLVASAIGLYFRWPSARILALAWLKIGALAIILVPIGVVLWMTMLSHGNVLHAMGGLLFAVLFLAAGPHTEREPIYMVVAALVGLAIFSYVCRRAYRYLSSDTVGEYFPRAPASGVPPDARDERFRAYALGATLVVLALMSQQRFIISQYRLPAALQTREHQEQMEKYREHELTRLVGEPHFVDGGKGMVLVLNTAPYGYVAVCYADLATGTVTRKEITPGELNTPGGAAYNMAGRFSPDTALFWSSTNEFIDLHSGARVKLPVTAQYDQFRPLGFIAGSKQFLIFDRNEMRIHGANTTTGSFAYSVDVTPPGGFTRDEYRNEFLSQIARGVFSKDRTHFAYLYLDTLYLLDTAAGKLESFPASGQRDYLVSFSSEGDRIVTMRPYATEPGAIFDLGSKASISHRIQGTALHFSSVKRSLIVSEPRSEDRTIKVRIFGTDAADPGSRRWQLPYSESWHKLVGRDGKRLYVYNSAAYRIDYLDLESLSGEVTPEFKPLPVSLPQSHPTSITYSPEHDVLAVVHSPRITLAKLVAYGDPLSTAVFDFTEFARPKKH